MFDINQVGTFLDLVADPTKYQKYVDELLAREKVWKETIGTVKTLEKAQAELRKAEVILESAKDKAEKISNDILIKQSLVDKHALAVDKKEKQVEQRERDVATLQKAVVEFREKAAESVQRARAVEAELAVTANTLATERAACAATQQELNNRLNKLKSVMT
jgi:chromosome segregation ATPase